MAMMYGWDGGWLWMMLMPVVWISLLALLVWAVIVLTRSGAGDPGAPTAEQLLDRRFVSGEIDPDEYAAMRQQLREQRRAKG
ncbi:SHOCT domain-containing protein [Lolliginicoccus suaedae]|uniref:SHOCT domain-containing protein n=1 Tax=Lolliginicoccus suaedae TaxID=2605429 RepID=UPI001CA8D900|nr:SHOCT domain-containing protein [Lolliginicoccus suaedae]